MTIVGQAEIDPFGSRVLAKHWPGVPNYGDVRNIGLGPRQCDQQGKPFGAEAYQPDAPPRWHVDLICGGFPCQDLSVAGKRAGLDGERSGLWFEFHRILSELRPAFCLIENVPGLLSSNSGRDFGIVLGGLDELGYVVGWAILDSQHFGVPQRRRRVYIVGGPTRASVQQILSLCEGGDWHPAKGRAAGQDVAYALNAGVRGTGDGHGNAWNSNYIADSLTVGANQYSGFNGEPVIANPLAAHHGRGDLDFDTYIPELAATLQAEMYHHGGYPNQSLNGENGFLIAHSLRAEGFDASEDGTGCGTPLVAIRTAQTSSNGWGVNEEGTAYTLDGANGQAVAFGLDSELNGAEEALGPLKSQHGGSGQLAAVATGASVRRLTPVECLRLQGFPDDWCDGVGGSDGSIYKAAGNAVSVPVIEYLGRRIMEVAG